MTITGWLFERSCRALLLAYPAEFRRRFGPEMLQLARQCEPRFRAHILLDLAANAGQERWLEWTDRAVLPRRVGVLVTVALAASLLLVSGPRVPVFEAAPLVLVAPPNMAGAIGPALADPTLAYVLIVAGLYGLIAELSAPGTLLPGSFGLLSLGAGLLSLALMPVNYAGLALLLAAVAVFLGGVKLPAHGLLTGAGLVLFVAGSSSLFSVGSSGLAISGPVLAIAAAASAVFFGVVARFGAKVRKLPPATGRCELVGKVARARTPLSGGGQVFVRGERWAARCEEDVPAGTPVEIVDVSGLTLTVRRLAMA